MTCDYVSRTIFAPSELPIGVITSIAGAPLFIYVMKKSRNQS
jgi:iron complex transport system permease protein